MDAILTCVYEHAKDRRIFFSSFSPDICVLLAQKQPFYPVAFLTDAGWEKMFDLRCNSLKDGPWLEQDVGTDVGTVVGGREHGRGRT